MFLTFHSFLLGELGTFALIKLLALHWGTLFIKMKSYLVEVQIGFKKPLSIYTIEGGQKRCHTNGST